MKKRTTTRPKTAKKVRVSTTVRVPKLRPTQKAGVLSVVRQMLAKNIENKTVGNPVETNVLHNSPIGAADCVPLIPQIPPMNVNNTTDTSMLRIGDRISPKSLRVKGTVSFTPRRSLLLRTFMFVLSSQPRRTSRLVLRLRLVPLTRRIYCVPPSLVRALLRRRLTVTRTVFDFPVNRDLFRVYMDKIIACLRHLTG